MSDSVDRIIEQWTQARPTLDVSAMGVLGRLSRVTRYVERQLQAVYSEHDLQAGEFDLLATLARSGAGPRGLTPGELSNSAMVTSGAITNRLDRLVEKRLVTRKTDAENRRTIRVALTERGQKKIDQALLDHVSNEEHLLSVLPAAQRDELVGLLRLMLQHYEGSR